MRSSPRANGYLALEPSLHQVQVGDHLFGFEQAGRNAFVVGGLHGPAEGAAEALVELRRALRRAGGRRVLVVPVDANALGTIEAAGFGWTQVAAEALVDPTDFTLGGSARAEVRQMCNRARRRSGLEVVEVDPATDADEREALAALHQRWLAARPEGHEMRLLVGTPQLDRPLGRRYFATLEPERGRPVAAVTLTPGWGGRGWGVDVMSREPSGPAGAMDLLLAETIERLGREGIERFSLGASPMAPVPGQRRQAPLRLRLLEELLFRTWLGRQLFPFRQLNRFKAKFAPRWRPVFLAGWPSMGLWAMYVSARMWGIFGPPPGRR